ncbi:hypothetical protein FQN54_003296 [Arachnomyces sp. PD_36]|nr:hypothetical protein FQN54_003296 [Arachnomyces sp. PD_36]
MSSTTVEVPPESTTPTIQESFAPGPIYNVPNEIILIIAESLEPADLNSLMQTSRRFAIILDPRLYDLAVTFTNTNTSFGHMSVLEWASIHGQISVVEKLLKRNVDLYSMDESEWTALHDAVHYNHEGIAKMLLGAGHAHSLTASDGDAPIHQASYNGNEGMVRLLIDAGSDVSLLGGHKRTPLHAASCKGHKGPAQFLLTAGADISLKDKFGFTPLHIALTNGHMDVVQVLLDAGSDLTVRCADGYSLLHSACASGNLETVKLLVDLYRNNELDIEEQDGVGMSVLHSVAGFGFEEIGRVLIQNGANLTTRWQGKPPLHIAAWAGRLSFVKLLVEKGADINAPDSDGRIALYYAAHKGHPAVVQYMLENGADPTVVGDGGWTALHTAAEKGLVATVEALLSYGANINATEADGWTPLHLAVSNKHEPLVDILLNRGAEIKPEKDGWTPLYVALQDDAPFSIVERLLQHVTEFGVEDMISGTILHLAVLYTETDTITTLLSKGADPMLLDGYGRTPMDYAALHDPTFELMKPFCKNYQPTDKSKTALIQRRSISKLAAKIRGIPTGKKRAEYYPTLGRLLLYANDLPEATTAHNLYIALGENYEYICGMCSETIEEELWACSICPRIDLCSSCSDEYAEENPTIHLCHQHQFTPVSLGGDSADQMSDERVNDQGESIQEWLSRLVESYGQDKS